ncbi:sulfur carrier protein ThiS, partial [Candidatus Calescamantes bacterium]|nr:sulfur carrier protein ThiS [Candidatus Calescamantes bacterium]
KASNLYDLVLEKELQLDSVIIEHNLKIKRRDSWPTEKIMENDTIEILRFVGGG